MNKKSSFFCPQFKKMTYLCTRFDAQMAESVDALVSNTNGVTPVPVRPRLWVRIFKRKALKLKKFRCFFIILLEHYWNIFGIDPIFTYLYFGEKSSYIIL